MGTKLHHTIDPLATNSFCQLDDWDYYFREKGKRPSHLFKFEDPVNTMLEQLHIESIKKTMLMHEDIFKQQVRELHRLYRVQRLLMDDLNNDTKPSRQGGTNICLDMNNLGFVRQDIPTAEYNIHIQSIRDFNLISAPECTASCSTEALRIPKRFDLQRPAEENMSTGASVNEEDQMGPITNMPLIETNAKSTDEGSNGIEVELTLSIGPSTAMKRSDSFMKHRSLQVGGSSGLVKKENRKEFTDTDANMGSSGTLFNQESKRPHWLFQDLSLNRT